jgi:hypothetical protein
MQAQRSETLPSMEEETLPSMEEAQRIETPMEEAERLNIQMSPIHAVAATSWHQLVAATA